MKHLLVFAFIIFSSHLFGQLGFNFYGSNGNDVIYEMTPAGHDTYFVVGGKSAPRMVIWLAKIRGDGAIIWEHTYGNDGDVYYDQLGYHLLITADSTFYIAAQARHNTNSQTKAILLKTDKTGNMIWKKYYDEVERILTLASDGNEILFSGLDFWSGYLLRIDTSGTVLSSIIEEVSDQTFIYRIIKTDDGNLLLIGRANVIGAGYSGLFFRKITPAGATIWTKAQETTSWDDDFEDITELFTPTLGVVQHPDGSFWIAINNANSPGIDLYQFDQDGNKLKTFKYGDNTHREFPTALLLTTDGSFLMTGATRNDSLFAMKVAPNGKEVWYRYYGNKNVLCIPMTAVETADRYLIGGTYQSDIAANSDFDATILRIEKDGNPFNYTIHGTLKLDQNQNCQTDAGDPFLPKWFVSITDDEALSMTLSDQSGYFEYKTNTQDLTIKIIRPDTSIWRLCEDSISVHVDAINPTQDIPLLVSPNEICADLEVSLTQPDFVKCNTSCLTATIMNRGNTIAESSKLRLDWDKELHLTSSSAPYQSVGKGIEMDIPFLDINEEYRVQLCFSLDCDVQLGSAHQINATLVPVSCVEDYTGSFISIDGGCEGNEVKFNMRNTGQPGSPINTYYSVYSNELLIIDHQQIQIPGNGGEKIISFPADGRTWRMEVDQVPEVPFPDHPIASVESCGAHNTGLHDVGLRNAFPTNDYRNSTSGICGANTYKPTNQIAAAVTGIGSYNFIDTIGEFEFTARLNNNVKDIAQDVFIELSFSTTYDVSTFQILSSTVPVELTLLDRQRIKIHFPGINLLKAQSAMARFRVSTITSLVPNDNDSFMKIEGRGYLDEIGPITLADAYYNYGIFDQSLYEQYSTYPDYMQVYGGRGADFGSGMAKGDGDYLFLAGLTNSFGDGTYTSAITKSTLSGKVEWQKIVEPDEPGSTNIYEVEPDGVGGCVFAGDFLPAEDADNYNYNHFYYGVIGRLDEHGELLWIKTLRPIGAQYGTIFSGVIKTTDQNYIAYGRTDQGSFKRMYVKFNNDGDSIWVRQFNSAPRLNPRSAVSYPDGSVVFVGDNLLSPFGNYTIAQKVNSSGNLLWERTIVGGVNLYGIAPAPNNGFLLSGTINYEENGDSYQGLMIILCDSSGQSITVEKHKTGHYYDLFISSAASDGEGGYFMTGAVRKTSDDYDDVILFKVDSVGKIVWTKQYGGPKWETAFDLICTAADSIYIFGNDQREVILYDLQAFLIRTDGQGEVTALHDEPILPKNESTWLFPNPAKENINVVLVPEPTQAIPWMVFDLLGRKILEGVGQPGDYFGVNSSLLNPGHYILCFPGMRYPSKIFVIEN